MWVKSIKRVGIWGMVFLFLVGILPLTVKARIKESETLKVGFSPQGIFMVGAPGEPKSGYGYEYLQRIASYGGWNYEYIYADFPEQLEMLEKGELDIVVNVSFTKQREDKMDFSEIPMGEENYYICVQKDSDITADNLFSLEGKRIGVTRNSYQLEILKQWVEEKKISCHIIETDGTSPEEGVDAYVTMDIYHIGDWNPLYKIGSSQYYFALNQKKEGLKEAFDSAQRSVLEITPYYPQQLHTKYFGHTLVNEDLNVKEQQWIKNNPTIYLGYYDNYLPYCDQDENGQISGFLATILSCMETALTEYGVIIETIPYSSIRDMKRDLREGGLHLAFPLYMDSWRAEEEGYFLSEAITELPMSLVYKETYSPQLYNSIAVTEQDPYQESYLLAKYPKAQILYYSSLEDCLQAVARGEVNCTVGNTLQIEEVLSGNKDFEGLKKYTNSENEALGIGVRKEDSSLLSITNRIIHQIPEGAIEKSIIEYAEENGRARVVKRTHEMMLTWAIILGAVLVSTFSYSSIIHKKAKQQQAANNEIIDVLGTVVEYRSMESGQHVKRVKKFTEILGNYMLKEYPEYQLTRRKLKVIVAASALHDVGKVAIPDHILLKPGKLTEEEFELMKKHTTKGSEILDQLQNVMKPEYAAISREICRYHHERFDGRGYPDRLREDEIPIAAQLVSIADVYDALTNERCYKVAFSCEEALQMIMEGQCGSFSPKLLKALENTKEEFKKCTLAYQKNEKKNS